MRKRVLQAPLLMLITMGMLWGGTLYAADIQNKLINFQGYLTDNANPPNPLDGTYDLTFRIYEKPGDLTPLWTEQHQGVTVIRGNVSVLLGSITEMNLVFDQPRYVGIQVGTDPEMIPRQRLLPAFHSITASTLVVKHANETRSEFGMNNIIPVGGIITYFGDTASLPDNWMVCDGSEVKDPASPLYGQTLPDMSGRVARGPVADEPIGHTGGQDSDSWAVTNHQHSIADDGQHSHTGTTSSEGKHSHSLYPPYGGFAAPPSPGYDTYLVCDGWGTYHDTPGLERVQRVTSTNPAHTHTFITSTTDAHAHEGATGLAGATSGTINTVPSYVALYYIIRIK